MPLGTETRNLSARNRWPGRVSQVRLGTVMAEVIMDCGGRQVVAAITRESAERLALREGDEVAAVVKATDVMVER